MTKPTARKPAVRSSAARVVTGIALMLALSAGVASSEEQADDAELMALDQACASAREQILSGERAQLVEECVAEKFPREDQVGCERFYADHGAAAGGRAPLYMDLPECVTAHEFRQNRGH